MSLYKDVVSCFTQYPTMMFCKDVYLLCYEKFETNPTLTQEFNERGASKAIIELRNKLRHGATLSEDDSKLYIQKYEPFLFNELLNKANFLSKISLVYFENDSLQHPLSFNFLLEAGYIPNLSISQFNFIKIHAFNHKTNLYLNLSPLLIFAKCKEFSPINKNIPGPVIDTKQCGHGKFLYFNDLKRTRQIVFLDYWQGHHSQFYEPELISDFTQIYLGEIKREGDWFEELIHSNIDEFVGREEEFDTLDSFVSNSSKRVIFVFGNPGIGKTTLLSKWAITKDHPRHFFREGEAKWQDPKWFFKNLSLQISSKYGSELVSPLREEVREYELAFKETLRKAAEKADRNNECLVMVIDGLDEANRSSKAIEQSILYQLPSVHDLPNNVKLVLSTRPNLLNEKLLQNKYPSRYTQKVGLNKLSIENIRALLMNGYSKYEIISNPDYVSEITSKSEGNPLYLKLLLEDLVSGEKAFGDLSKLPKGIEEYFGQILDEYQKKVIKIVDSANNTSYKELDNLLKNSNPEFKDAINSEIAKINRNKDELKSKCFESLTLFCLAREPISLQLIHEVVGIDPDSLKQCFGFLHSVLSEAEDGEFAIFHSGFRDYFLNGEKYNSSKFNVFAKFVVSTKKKLLDWCSDWPRHHSLYALNNFILHLLEEKESREKIYVLAMNPDFLISQRTYLPNGIQAMLSTIRSGLTCAIENKEAARIAEFLFEYSKYIDELEIINPLEHLRTGSIEETCSLIDIYEPKYCLLWYLLASYYLIENNRTQDAIKVINTWYMKKIDTPVMFGWEGKLFDQLIEELLSKLLDTTTYHLFWELTRRQSDRIIRYLIISKMTLEAFNLANSIEDIFQRYGIFSWIAIEQVRQGYPQKALHTVFCIQDGKLRSKALKKIIEEQIIKDLYPVVEKEIRESNLNAAPSPIFKSGFAFEIYKTIAEKWAKSGDYLASLRTINNYFNGNKDYLLDMLVENVTAIFIDKHDVESCYNIIPFIEDDELQERVFYAIAVYQIFNMEIKSAISTLNKYKNEQNLGIYSPDTSKKRDREIITYIRALNNQKSPDEIMLEYELDKSWKNAFLEIPIYEKAENGNLIEAIEDAFRIFKLNVGDTIDIELKEKYLVADLFKTFLEYFDDTKLKEAISLFIEKYPEKGSTVEDSLKLAEGWLAYKVKNDDNSDFEISNPSFLITAAQKIMDVSSKINEKLQSDYFEDALVKIIMVYLEKGDFKTGTNLQERLSIPYYKNKALHYIVMEYIKRNETKEWPKYLLSMQEAEYKPGKQTYNEFLTKCEIIKYYIQINLFDTALEFSRLFNCRQLEYQLTLRSGVEELKAARIVEGLNIIIDAALLRLEFLEETEVEFSDLSYPSGVDYFDIYKLLKEADLQQYLQNILINWKNVMQTPSMGGNIGVENLRKAGFLINIAKSQVEFNFYDDASGTLSLLLQYLKFLPINDQIDILKWSAELHFYMGDKISMANCLSTCLDILKSSCDACYENNRSMYFTYEEKIREINILIKRIEHSDKKKSFHEIEDEIYDFGWGFACGEENYTRWTEPGCDRVTTLFEITEWYNHVVEAQIKGIDVDFIDIYYFFNNYIKIWADRGEFNFAKQVTRIIGNEYEKSENFLKISLAQIKFGEYENSIDTAFEIMEKREESLYAIAQALVEKRSIPEFLKLLHAFSLSRNLVCAACGFLAQAFPEQVDDITLLLI